VHERRQRLVVDERGVHPVARVAHARVGGCLLAQAARAHRDAEARERARAGVAEEPLRLRGLAAHRAALREQEGERVVEMLARYARELVKATERERSSERL
jgi:hypothetical protein